MKKILLISLLCLIPIFNKKAGAIASVPTVKQTVIFEEAQEATQIAQPIIEVKENITEPKSEEAKEKFGAVLNQQKLRGLNPTNFLKHSIRFAVFHGVPANTLTLILLLPLVGALVGIIQYFIGLSGFGIFTPAMVAVAFLATGISGGLILFGAILIATIATGKLLKKIKLHYQPRRAITLMMISLITFFLLVVSPFLGLADLTQVSIFPILFLILLSEEFTRTQLGKSRRSAISLTAGTIVISIIGASLMNWEQLQKLILLNPEISFLVVLALNIIIGKYGGWRLLEYRRFKSILEK